MWLHADPSTALSLAVRLCAVGQLVGLVELALARDELRGGGFLDWSMIGSLSPRARTRLGNRIWRAFRRISPRAFGCLVMLDALAACALLVRPAAAPLIAATAALQMIVVRRHHITVDGSDQMMLVVLLACLLGRVGDNATSARAAVTFLAAEVTLAYLVGGVSKAASTHWRSGDSLPTIVQTRMYGQATVARLLRSHPELGRIAGFAVFGWESLFLLGLTAPPAVLVCLLALGVGFHAGCALVMGLNRFVWAFAASYPAVVCTNLAIRAAIGAQTADTVTAVAAVATVLGLVAMGGLVRARSLACR